MVFLNLFFTRGGRLLDHPCPQAMIVARHLVATDGHALLVVAGGLPKNRKGRQIVCSHSLGGEGEPGSRSKSGTAKRQQNVVMQKGNARVCGGGAHLIVRVDDGVGRHALGVVGLGPGVDGVNVCVEDSEPAEENKRSVSVRGSPICVKAPRSMPHAYSQVIPQKRTPAQATELSSRASDPS